MLEKIGEEAQANGTVIEWAWCSDVESPRTWECNLGHMLTWTRGYSSPDENPYDTPEAFMEEMLKTCFTFDELAEAVRSGMFGTLRFERDGQGREHLMATFVNWLSGEEGWDLVEEYDDWPDSDTLAECIAQCHEAAELLSRAVAMRTVYMLDHSGIAYSTSPFNDRWDSGAVGVIWADEDDVSNWFEGVPAPRRRIEKRLDYEVERYSQWAEGEVYAVMLSDADGSLIDCVGGYIGADDLEVGIEDMRKQSLSAA